MSVKLFHLNDMIQEFFRYFYYRWAHAMINFGWSKNYSFHCANWNSGIIISNIYTIILILAYLIIGEMQRDTELLLAIPSLIIGLLLLNKIFPDNDDERFYKMLDEKYRDEKYRKLKGYLVVLYYILSLFSFIAVSIFVAQHK